MAKRLTPEVQTHLDGTKWASWERPVAGSVMQQQRQQHYLDLARHRLEWFLDYTMTPARRHDVYAGHLLEQHFAAVERLIDKELRDG